MNIKKSIFLLSTLLLLLTGCSSGSSDGEATTSTTDTTGTTQTTTPTTDATEEENAFNPFNIAKLSATEGSFGYAVATDGEYTIISAYDDRSAYLYKKDDNDEMHFISKFSGTNVANSNNNSEFALSVAIDGEYVVIGDPSANGLDSNDEYTGNVYIFKIDTTNDTIAQVALFEASVLDYSDGDDFFGQSVDIDNNLIIVGAKNASGYGKAYLFEFNPDDNSVEELAVLGSSSVAATNQYGALVAIHNNHILVGSVRENIMYTNAGALYVYEIDENNNTNVVEIEKIYSTNPERNAAFPSSIDIDDEYIVLGDQNNDTTFNNAGEVAVYKIDSANSSVSYLSSFQSPTDASDNKFGTSVSIYNKRIAVGSKYTNQAFLYEIDESDNIALVKELTSSTYDGSNIFYAYSINISQESIVIGTLYNNEAYIFSMQPTDRAYMLQDIPSELNVSEGYVEDLVQLYITSPNDDHSVSITGDDGSYFSSANYYLIESSSFDYELPLDADSDNTYNITISATTPAFSTSTTFDMQINIQDKEFISLAKVQADSLQGSSSDGADIAKSGDYIVVGSAFTNSAYVYKLCSDGSTTQIAQLENNASMFGAKVAIDGEYIVVSAYDDNTSQAEAGSVSLYKIDTTDDSVEFKQYVQADIPLDYGNFGSALSMSDGYLIVGSVGADSSDGTTDAGLAYMFELDTASHTINQIAIIQADTPSSRSNFGSSVAISGDYISIGASAVDLSKGKVYFYKYYDSNTSVSFLSSAQPSTTNFTDSFATSISMSAEYIVVGSPYSDDNGSSSGSAYLYKIDTSNSSISEISKILPDEINANDKFGKSLSIDGDYISVAAPYNGKNEGAVFVFKIDSADDSITQVDTLKAYVRNKNDIFGDSLFMKDGVIVTSRPDNSTNGFIDNGSVYLYELDSN